MLFSATDRATVNNEPVLCGVMLNCKCKIVSEKKKSASELLCFRKGLVKASVIVFKDHLTINGNLFHFRDEGMEKRI